MHRNRVRIYSSFLTWLLTGERSAGANFPGHSLIMGLSIKNVIVYSHRREMLARPKDCNGRTQEGSRK